MAKTQHGRELTAVEMAQMLEEWANAAHQKEDKEKFAEQLVHRTHRTLQQGCMGVFVACIEKWAATEHFDGRNEATVRLCQKIVAATGDKYDRMLPYI
jgi:hypothetical protein